MDLSGVNYELAVDSGVAGVRHRKELQVGQIAGVNMPMPQAAADTWKPNSQNSRRLPKSINPGEKDSGIVRMECIVEFHEKLQELRKSRRLTQAELAELLYVSRTAISNMVATAM